MPPHPLARFLRFCVVGASSALGSLVLFWLLMRLGHLPYLLAFAMTFCVMNALGYLASRRMVFKNTPASMRGGLARYFLVAGVTLAVNTAALRGLVGGLGWHPLIASAALSLANAPFSYLLHRRVTFGLRAANDQVELSR